MTEEQRARVEGWRAFQLSRPKMPPCPYDPASDAWWAFVRGIADAEMGLDPVPLIVDERV